MIAPMPNDMQKQSLYFPEGMLKEIKEEAERLDRSTSWVVTKAWVLAKEKIRKMKATDSGE